MTEKDAATEPLTEPEEKTAEPLAETEKKADASLKLPLISKILFIIFGVSAICLAVCFLSRDFADFFERYIASVPRALMAWLTGWIPFSLVEFFVIILVPAAVIIIVKICRRASGSWHDVGVACLAILSVLSFFFTSYVFSLGAGYRGSGLDEKLGIERRDVSAAELKETALILVAEMEKDFEEVTYGADHFSIMPYNVAKMNTALNDAYAKACKQYEFIQPLRSRVKQVMLSEPWTYTHITGVYSYFTGEANININMPDYTIPYTAAHELAHQRGIAREDEANFVAYLVCRDADDAYLRYSGAVNMFEYVASALASADSDAYREVWNQVPQKIRKELVAYSSFFSKYRKSVVATVSEKVNDTYLKINGTAGTKSYGMVVDLCVAYYIEAEGD